VSPEPASATELDASAPYEQLVAMIEHELELVNDGRYAQLAEAVERRSRVLATLAIPGPEAAWPALERARCLHERLIVDTMRARDALGRSITHLTRLRQAAGNYRQAVSHRYSTSV
jgi:hypothetical protein